MIPAWILALAIVVIGLGVAYGVRNQVNDLLGCQETGSVNILGSRPVIWWHVDDSQVNGKEWTSFEDRATREPNEPYLALCLKKAQRQWSSDFEVVPLIGRACVLERLRTAGCVIPTGAERVPPALWMAWCRTAVLAHLGGLWLDGSVLPLSSATAWEVRRRLAGHAVLTFGADADEELSAAEQKGGQGGPAAGRAAGWAAAPGHPMWTGLCRDIGAVVKAGDQSWSSFEARRSLRFLWDKHCSGVTRVDRKAEVSRDKYGKRLDYDDLFAKKEWINGSTEGGLWVPLPDGRDKLERTSAWLWFTRLSEEQIAESEFVWARLATRA
jgi:hypothetical protein